MSIIHFTRNGFSAQLADFVYLTAEKHPNLGNWAYNYLIKIRLFLLAKKPICSGLVL